MAKVIAYGMYDNHAGRVVEAETIAGLVPALDGCFKEDPYFIWGKVHVDGVPIPNLNGGFHDLTPLNPYL